MIVRISRARVKPNSESAAFEILRKAAAGVARPEGLEAMFISRRMAATGNELVAITVWRDMDSLTAVMSGDWQTPRFLPSLDSLLEDATVEHYETVVESFESLEHVGT